MAPASDLFEWLPDAVLSIILEKAECMRSCLLVCRRWRQVCESATWLSVRVKVSTNRSPISARYRGRLKYLKLLADFEVPVWEWFEEFKDNLENLSIEGGTLISKVGLIFECPNLKRLTICSWWQFLLNESFEHTPTLKHLTELEIVAQTCDVCGLESMIRLCPRLKRLVVNTVFYSGGPPEISSTTLEELEYHATTLHLDAPNLKIMKLNTHSVTAKVDPCLHTLVLNNGLVDSDISDLRCVDRLVFARGCSFTDCKRMLLQMFKDIEVRSLQLLARFECHSNFTGFGDILAAYVKCARLEITSDLFKPFKAAEVPSKMPGLKKFVVHACDLNAVFELKHCRSWLVELKRGGQIEVVVKIVRRVYQVIPLLVRELQEQVNVQASELEEYKYDDDHFEGSDDYFGIYDDYASYDGGWEHDEWAMRTLQ